MKYAAFIVAALVFPAFCQAQTVCIGGNCGASVYVQTPGVRVQVAPPVVYQPQVTYKPYVYRGSTISERRYPTPWRDRWFGRYSIQHYYRAK